MYDVCHDIEIPCTRYLTLNHLYPSLCLRHRTEKVTLFNWHKNYLYKVAIIINIPEYTPEFYFGTSNLGISTLDSLVI